MATYQPCDETDKTVLKFADALMRQFHPDLLEAKVKIDFLFAYPRYNEKDQPIGDAIKHHGVKALGLAKKLGASDRAKGHGDAEIRIDWEWWKESGEAEQKALLDHELHHLAICKNKAGVIKTDDLGRPVIRLRPHDYQIGWFNVIAHRHGVHSQERKQAQTMFEKDGQIYWPSLVGQNESRITRLEARQVNG